MYVLLSHKKQLDMKIYRLFCTLNSDSYDGYIEKSIHNKKDVCIYMVIIEFGYRTFKWAQHGT